MRRDSPKNTVKRIIDANINRAKEGLRVCEEITRFILEDYKLTAKLKKLRHAINTLAANSLRIRELLQERDASGDVGKNISGRELKRKNIRDIFFANIQRAKESLRVLEEFSKLIKPAQALAFKKLRYEAYELEKEVAGRIALLRHN